MLKRLLRTTLACFAFLCGGSLFGQAGDYVFSVSTSTYTPLGASATVVADLEADSGEDTVGIGFNFDFEGVTYDSVAATSDGFLSFVVGATSTASNDLDNGSSLRRPLIAPLWDDHDGGASSSQARYEVSGTAPNRVFTFEWSNWEWSWNSTDSVVSFQAKLYETTNVIEFVYNWECSSCVVGPDASIGLSGASTFLSVTGVGSGSPSASNTSEDSSIDTVVTNQVFTFTPPACTTPTYTGASVVTSSAITIDWTHATATNFEVNWDTTGFTQGAVSSNTSSVSTNSYSATSLNAGQGYDFYIRTDCGGGIYSNWSGPYTVTTAYVPPYLEDWANGYPHDWTEAAGLIANPTVFSSTTSSTWSSDGFSNSGSSGAARVNIWSTGADEWLISPSIDLGTGSITYQFEFDASLTPYASTSSSTLGIDDSVKVVISTDNGVTWSNANTLLTLDNSTSIMNGGGNHYVINLAGYTGVVKFAFYAESTVSNADNDFFIDNVEIGEVPACPEPQFLADSNITTSSVDLGWQSAGSGPWYIYWGPCGFDQASSGVTIDTVTTNQYVTMSGLASNTAYQFYLFEDCGAQGFSDTVDFGCISTDCGPLSVPFYEGFNSNSLAEHCWTVLDSNNDGDAWNLDYTSNTYDGDQVAMMYTDFNSGNNNDWLITPPLALTGNERLRFNYRVQSAGEPNDFMILASTTGTNPSDFTDTLLPLASYSNTTYQELMMNINAYSGTTYLAWHIPAGGLDGWRLYIDSVVVEAIPPCPASTGLTSTSVGSDSIQISWISGGSALVYGIEYGVSGFTPGSGNFMSTTDTFDVANGLSANTPYDFYVYDTCASGASIALGPITVSTLCNNIVAPYLETFDGISWGAGSAFGVGDTLDDCWSRNSETGYKWSVLNTSTGSSSTGPDADHTGAGGNFLYTEASNSSPSLAMLTTPNIDVSALTTPYVSFWYHRYGTTAAMGDLVLEIYDRNGWDTLLTITGVQQTASTDPYTEIGVDVSAYGDTIQLRLVGVQKATYQGDMAIDDFSVDEAPSCLPILNLTADGIIDTAATMRWGATTTATSYEVWYGPQGFYQGSATVGGVKANAQYDSLYIDSLSQNTCYEFVVRGICGPGDTTSWAGPYVFCTPRSCPLPTGLAVSQIKTDSALVYWAEGTSGFVNTEVIYTVGNQPASAGMVLNTTNDSIWLSGLTNATNYCVYIVEQCSNKYADTVGPVCFSTLCLPQSLPYYENFDVSLGCFTPIDGGDTDDTWMHVQNYNGSTLDGTPFAFVNSDGAGSGNLLSEQLVSVQIDASNITDPLILEYDQYFNNFSSDSAIVEVFDGTSWVQVAGYSSDLGSFIAPDHDSIDISAYANANLQVRFRYEDFNVWAWYWAIDNVSIMEMSSCPTPANVTVSNISCDSVEVSWTSDVTATASYVEYGTKGFSLGSGTVIANAVSPVTINGLMLDTEYDVYVIDSCSMVPSNPTQVLTFETDSVGPVLASFTYSQVSTTLTDADVDLDASGSTGDGLTYSWDFDNGNNGTGVNAQANYTANSTYSVTLTVTDRCGNTDDTTVAVTVAGISIVENEYNAGIEMYPNPNNGTFKVNVSNGNGTYTIQIMELSGKVIYTRSELTPGHAELVELNNVAEGVYMVRLVGDGLNVTQRILID